MITRQIVDAIENEAFMTPFTLDEAVSLMGRTVIDTENPKEGIARLGVVVGILELNDEIELVVRFMDRLSQSTRAEFVAQYDLVRDD